MSNQLTKDQINNWRKALVVILGPYALVASDREIQTFRDNMQGYLDGDANTAVPEAQQRAAVQEGGVSDG